MIDVTKVCVLGLAPLSSPLQELLGLQQSLQGLAIQGVQGQF